MIKRELYLRKLRPFYPSELVKVISGIRRCGKSTLLKQIMEELKASGVPDTHMIYVNLEDYQYRSLTDPDAFYQYIEERIPVEGLSYLFFDEIQNVRDFELVVNSFRSTHNTSIFMTGSNSKLLSGELASHLGGRTVSFRVLPFNFKEFCEFRGYEKPAKELFHEYLQWGGFPLVCSAPDDNSRMMTLASLYDSIVLKDIIMRNKISYPQSLEKILEYLIANSSATLSGKNIAASLSDCNQSLSGPTVYDYIRYIVDACIVDKVERYDIRGRKVLAFEGKTYVCDLGFFQLKKNRVKDEWSLLIETVIFNELIARGYKVYIGKTYRGEIDFIAELPASRIYIQAAYLMSDESTIQREFGAFASIQDHYPKYVISMDPITSDRDGIRHLNLLDFLLNEDTLS